MFALESFSSPGSLQITALQKDKCRYMMLHIPSMGFQEEKLCLLHTDTLEATQTEGLGDGIDRPGQGRAVGLN